MRITSSQIREVKVEGVGQGGTEGAAVQGQIVGFEPWGGLSKKKV